MENEEEEEEEQEEEEEEQGEEEEEGEPTDGVDENVEAIPGEALGPDDESEEVPWGDEPGNDIDNPLENPTEEEPAPPGDDEGSEGDDTDVVDVVDEPEIGVDPSGGGRFNDTVPSGDGSEYVGGEIGEGEVGEGEEEEGEGEFDQGDALVFEGTLSPTPLPPPHEEGPAPEAEPPTPYPTDANDEGDFTPIPPSPYDVSPPPTPDDAETIYGWGEEEEEEEEEPWGEEEEESPWGEEEWGRPTYPTERPSPRPTTVYIPKDEGDPLDTQEEPDIADFTDDQIFYHGLGGTVGEYLDGVESPQELEQDKNVQVIAGTLVAVFLVMLLITAHFVMHYPDGLCAGCCRLTLRCICCFIRTLCLPCRAICCKGSDQSHSRRTHAPMRTPFPTDLELA